MDDPVIDEAAAVDEVGHPAGQALEGRVGSRRPQLRHVLVEERVVHHLQLLAHHHEALDGLLQLGQGRLGRQEIQDEVWGYKRRVMNINTKSSSAAGSGRSADTRNTGCSYEY